MDLIVKVREIKGTCSVYRVGDSFKLEDGYRLVSDRPLCMHSLAALMPHYNALKFSDPADWGLAKKDEPGKAFVQCHDPQTYTGGGTVVFEITKSAD